MKNNKVNNDSLLASNIFLNNKNTYFKIKKICLYEIHYIFYNTKKIKLIIS